MKPNTEQVIDLFKRAITLKADSYLNKVNFKAEGNKKQRRAAEALAASTEDMKFNEVVSRAVELYAELTSEEQREVLNFLTKAVDLQKKVLERHPASFQAWATNDTAELFMQKTKGSTRTLAARK